MRRILGLVMLLCCSISFVTAEAVTPASDFMYELNREGTGVMIYKYKGAGKKVVIPSVIEDFPVLVIGGGVFREQDIVSVSLPASVKKIWGSAFKDCTSLKSVTITNGVEYIDGGAFKNCTALESVTIPASVKEIMEDTFSGCTSLKSVTIANGVEYIGEAAFQNCTALESITIPASVKKIQGDYFTRGAFYGCTSLKSVTIEAKNIDWHGHVFSGCSSLSLKEEKKLRDSGYTGEF